MYKAVLSPPPWNMLWMSACTGNSDLDIHDSNSCQYNISRLFISTVVSTLTELIGHNFSTVTLNMFEVNNTTLIFSLIHVHDVPQLYT